MTEMPSLPVGRPARRSHSRGFTLIEVLIAIVILSIGVLGALGMQVNAIRMNKEVRYQSVALTLARELAEKMRGNHVVAVETTTSANPYLLNTNASTSLSAPSTNCYNNPCTTGADIARWDVYEWQLRMREALPSPRIVICMDSDPFDTNGVPKWSCNNTGNVAMLKVAWNRATTTGTTEFTSDTGSTGPVPMLVLPLTAGSSQ